MEVPALDLKVHCLMLHRSILLIESRPFMCHDSARDNQPTTTRVKSLKLGVMSLPPPAFFRPTVTVQLARHSWTEPRPSTEVVPRRPNQWSCALSAFRSDTARARNVVCASAPKITIPKWEEANDGLGRNENHPSVAPSLVKAGMSRSELRQLLLRHLGSAT